MARYLTYLLIILCHNYLIDRSESFEQLLIEGNTFQHNPKLNSLLNFYMLTLFQYIKIFNFQTDMRIGMVGHPCLDCH